LTYELDLESSFLVKGTVAAEFELLARGVANGWFGDSMMMATFGTAYSIHWHRRQVLVFDEQNFELFPR